MKAVMELEELPQAPDGLLGALRREEAQVLRLTDHAPRYHIRLSSPQGPLFGWYSVDRRGPEVLRHELMVRAALGEDGPLRAPPVLAHGANWRVERMIASAPLTGEDALRRVVSAALQVAGTPLPQRTRAPRTRAETVLRMRRRAERMALLARSPLPMRDWWRARRVIRDLGPQVTSHGSFIPVHVLLANSAVYVIDWEDLDMRPRGWDLMQFWAALRDEADRGTLMDLAVDMLGSAALPDLRKVRYAALVSHIVSKLAEDPQFGERDAAEANELLGLLPGIRAEALGAS